MSRNWDASCVTGTRPNAWRNEPAYSWAGLPARMSRRWRPKLTRTQPPSGACANGIVGAGSRPLCLTHRAVVGRALFSSRQRQQLERLARRKPRTVGWELTHWSTRSLAQAAVQREIVPDIHATTVATILRTAKLQPHRYRFWKTTLWTDEAIERALKILWL